MAYMLGRNRPFIYADRSLQAMGDLDHEVSYSIPIERFGRGAGTFTGHVGFLNGKSGGMTRCTSCPGGPCWFLEGKVRWHGRSQLTSAIIRGGTRMWVIVGEPPTLSSAISSASANVEAGLNPNRFTALVFPPTTMTLER